MKSKKNILTGILLLFCLLLQAQTSPKREFRGAWISVIWQSQYQHMSVAKMKSYFLEMLDTFQSCNINALVFQVRPSADAFYYSEIEPWSRWLTGVQGQAPAGNFDPMAFLIEACHKRGMEFHAWLNPYRVTASAGETLAVNHLFYRQPERFVRYGNQIYFDPGIPENRRYICRIVKDIVTRYDVDAIHTDDYFYPYPVAGEKFPDDDSFFLYASSQGFSHFQRADWRRNNVNELIREIKNTIVLTKPWVRFGVSPFGIYRNKKSTLDHSGSDTNGLQNYDDLYADVLLWAEKGWIDYLVPQIYWEIGHPSADYATLVDWWAKNKKGKGHLYVGQDAKRTMNATDPNDPACNQLPRKMELQRFFAQMDGCCWWSGYQLLENKVLQNELKANHQSAPALIPAYAHLHEKRPKDVKSLKTAWTENGYMLHWKKNGDPENPENAQYYVIYRFKNKEKVNLDDPSKIVAKTGETFYFLPYERGKEKYKYVVTSVDHFHNETKKGKSKTVKL